MRAKRVKILDVTFEEFIKTTPRELQEIIEKAKKIKQSPTWHPEGDVYTHIKIVFNRALKTNDINFIISAFFHDLGKVEATKFINNKWSAHGHEFASLRLLERHKNWVEELGIDYDIVHYIVKNHMRAKQLHQMRRTKREAFMKDAYFPLVDAFSKFDDMQTDYTNDIDS